MEAVEVDDGHLLPRENLIRDFFGFARPVVNQIDCSPQENVFFSQ